MVVVFDLDDTLYDEIDFVKSGFQEIAKYLGDLKYFDFMWELFLKEGSGKIFNKLLDKFNLNEDVRKLVEIYRFHWPNISISKKTKDVLKFCKSFKTALITDSHYIMQKNKFRVLGLGEYIFYPIFTDFFHTDKLDKASFKMVENYYMGERKFVYIGDNPKKDFTIPRKLGWVTIRFKNPRGIYKEIKNNAEFEILDITDVVDILNEIKQW